MQQYVRGTRMQSELYLFFVFFFELESDTDSVGYLFLYIVFAPCAFDRSVRRKLSTSQTVGVQSCRANIERFIVEMSKKKTLSMPCLLRCSNESICYHVPKLRYNMFFSDHQTYKTHMGGYSSFRTIFHILSSESEPDIDNNLSFFVFILEVFSRSVGRILPVLFRLHAYVDHTVGSHNAPASLMRQALASSLTLHSVMLQILNPTIHQVWLLNGQEYLCARLYGSQTLRWKPIAACVCATTQPKQVTFSAVHVTNNLNLFRHGGERQRVRYGRQNYIRKSYSYQN